jgi:hypothetical protein
MRFMILVKADRNREAGVMPSALTLELRQAEARLRAQTAGQPEVGV